MKKTISNISKKTLLIILGLTIGMSISVFAASTWQGTSFLQDAITQKRVLMPDDNKKIKDNLEYLKNNSRGLSAITVVSKNFGRGGGTVYCSSDYQVISGGHLVTANPSDVDYVWLRKSRPNGNGWEVAMQFGGGGGSVRAYAVCMKK